MSATTMLYDTIDTPLGQLLLARDEIGLTHVDLPHEKRPVVPGADWRRDHAALREARRQFDAWFSGELRAFDLPLHAVGTVFQRSVWQALVEIPYAQTQSYGGLAAHIGKPRGTRGGRGQRG